MQNSKPNRTRITVERISVTSIRRQAAICELCAREMSTSGQRLRPSVPQKTPEAMTRVIEEDKHVELTEDDLSNRS